MNKKRQSVEQALLVRFKMPKGIDLGDVFELSDQLSEAIAPVPGALFDGNDVEPKTGKVTLFMYADSARELFKKAKPVLERSGAFNKAEVTLRYGAADDPDVKEVVYDIA